MKKIEGIVVRHGRRCATQAGALPVGNKTGAKCDCLPSYRAQVNTKDGKVRRTFSGPGALAAAKAWRHDASAQVHKGTFVGPSKVTFAEASAAWLEGASAAPPTVLTRSGRRYKPSALRSIKRDTALYLDEEIGHLRLSEITRGRMQAVVDSLGGRGLSASRVRNIVNGARCVFRHAVERDDLAANPCSHLRLPATADPVNRAIDPTVVRAWIDCLPEADRALWAVAFYAGLRRGELQGLRWSDVTLLDGDGPLGGWINVQRSWDKVEGVIEPKSRNSKRRVPIVRPYLSDLLADHQRITRRGGDDYIFGTTATRPFKDYEGRTAAARKAANVERAKAELEPLPKFGAHDARHTFGAMLRAAGVRESDISDFLGHSRPGGVTVRYTSVLEADARDADAMALFASYLRKVDSGDRIEQLAFGVPEQADDLAHMLVERFGVDALERVAEALLAPVEAS